MSKPKASIASDATLRVNLQRLQENYARLTELSAEKVGAVVKANAYGLGMAQVSDSLWVVGCRHYFTATIAEALDLRALRPDAEIFVMSPSRDLDVQALQHASVVPCIYSLQQLQAVVAANLSVSPEIALHFDTGIQRLGLSDADVDSVKDLARNCDVRLIMSHYASADDPHAALNNRQHERLAKIMAHFPDVPASMANSGGVLLGEGFSPGLSRVGISLYGVDQHGLGRVRPVASFRATVLQVRDLAVGDGVGYSHTWRAKRATRLAVVAAGYADGVPRAWSSTDTSAVRVAIGSGFGEIVGRVSMDLTTVALDSDVSVEAGDQVEFFGDEIAIEQQAAAASTASYELLTRISSRVDRVYTNS